MTNCWIELNELFELNKSNKSVSLFVRLFFYELEADLGWMLTTSFESLIGFWLILIKPFHFMHCSTLQGIKRLGRNLWVTCGWPEGDPHRPVRNEINPPAPIFRSRTIFFSSSVNYFERGIYSFESLFGFSFFYCILGIFLCLALFV